MSWVKNSNLPNETAIKRLGISTNNKLTIDGVEQTTSSGGSATSRWSGKVWDVLGDSITYGYGSVPYHTHIKTDKGISTVNNYGLSGTTIAVRSGRTDSMLERYVNMSDADLITVMGGVNDLIQVIPLGVMSDRVNNTFYGACHLLYKGLFEKFLGKSIGVITPIQKTGSNTSLKTYVDAQKEVAAYYNLPVLDLFNQGGFPSEVTTFKDLYMPDGLHPSTDGHKLLAKRIGSWIETI